MTLEMQEMLEREYDDAMKIADPQIRAEAMTCVNGHQLKALIDCSRKTAERVKQVRAHDDAIDKDIEAIKKALAPCIESDREYRQAKSNAKAVKGFLGWAIPVIKKTIELVGAPTAAIIFCKLTGILW